MRPPESGSIVLQVGAAMAVAFVFTVGSLLLQAAAWSGLAPAGGADRGLLLVWVLPIVAVTSAAMFAKRRGWRGAAIGFWISLGLIILSTALCGVLVGGV